MTDFRAMAREVHRLSALRRLGIEPIRPTAAAERSAAILSAVRKNGVVPADWASARAKRMYRSQVSTMKHAMALALSEPRAFAMAFMAGQVAANVRVAQARDSLRRELDRRMRGQTVLGLPIMAQLTRMPEWWVSAWLDSHGKDERPIPVPATPEEVEAVATKLADMSERLRRHAALKEIRRLQDEEASRLQATEPSYVPSEPASEEEEDAIMGSPT